MTSEAATPVACMHDCDVAVICMLNSKLHQSTLQYCLCEPCTQALWGRSLGMRLLSLYDILC